MEKTDFIEVYEGAFSKEYCEELIAFFDDYECSGMTESRRDEGSDGTQKKDNFLFINDIDIMRTRCTLVDSFNDVFWGECYPEYSKKYDILASISEQRVLALKLQKTRPSEGYHVWHCEQDGPECSQRLMAFTVYLNDDYEAGETEFLYQQKRIKGNQGDVCIFPASYTHTHRGNPPMVNNKYILTGWLEF